MVGAAGFEPTTSSTPWKRATKLRYAPNCSEHAFYLAGPSCRTGSNCQGCQMSLR